MEASKSLPANNDNTRSKRQYLLGALPVEDTTSLEEDFFSDDATFEEIEIAEDDLVDAYVRDELSPAEREQFEKNLLGIPRVAERIEFAKVLKQATRVGSQRSAIKRDPGPRKHSSWQSFIAFLSAPQLARVAGALVLVIAGTSLFFDWLRLREESRRLAFERTELQRQNEILASSTDAEKRQLLDELKSREALNEKLMEDLESVQNQPRRPILMSPIVLFPGVSRSPSGSDDLTLPSRTAMIRLQLALESVDYPSYNAEVRKGVDGPIKWKGNKLKPFTSGSSKILELRFQSARLTPGNYIVNVDGLNPSSEPEFVATYNFRVVEKGD